MKHLLITISFLLLGTSFIFSQNKISGYIKDLQTQSTLPGATLRIENSQTGTTTDENGYFELDMGENTGLEITYIGYVSKKITVKDNLKLNILLEPDNLQLSEVQVIGYDNETKLRDTPGSISLVTRKDFQRGNTYSFLPVLNTIPGVRVDQSNLSDARISIRGVGARSPFGNRNLKFYLNEIPLTEADGFTRIEGLDISTLGRAEVLKGPASSIYGAGLGGVINFQLEKSPYDEKSIETTGLAGSFGLYRTATTYRAGTDKMNITATYGYQKFDGYREHSEDNRKFFTSFSQFFPSEKQTVSFLLNRTAQESQIPGAITAEQAEEDPRQANQGSLDQNARRDQTWTRLGVSHKYEFNNYFSNISSVYTSFYDLDHPLPFAYLRNFLQTYGGRTRFVYQPNFKVLPTKFIVGGEYMQSRVKATRYVNLGGEIGNLVLDNEEDNLQYSVFYQSETKVTKSTFLTLGVSLNKVDYTTLNLIDTLPNGLIGDVSTDFDFNVSPRLGLLQKLTKTTSLHASISTGFSPPTSGEVEDSEGNINPDLDAETGINYEIGSKGSLLDGKLTYDVALFLLNTENELVPQAISPFQSIFINAGETERKGFEAYVSYLFVNNPKSFITVLKGFSTYSYSDFSFNDFATLDVDGNVANDFSGNELTGIAPHVLNIGLDIRTKIGFYLYGTFFFNDKFPINDSNEDFNAAYNLLNVKLGFEHKLGKSFAFNIYGGADNLLDEAYTSRVTLNANDGLSFFNPSPSQSFYGGLSLKYIFK